MNKQKAIALTVVFILAVLFLMLLVALPYTIFMVIALFFKTLKFTLVFVLIFWGLFIVAWWLYKLIKGV